MTQNIYMLHHEFVFSGDLIAECQYISNFFPE